MAFVMTIRLSSGIRVPFLLSAKHTTEIGGGTGPSTRIIFKLRHYRAFTAFRLPAQRLFTALSTETYPGFPQACPQDLRGTCSSLSTPSSTGLPQFIHRGACS